MILGDYMNSKEYRKPEWVTRMEEIQKRWIFYLKEVVILFFGWYQLCKPLKVLQDSQVNGRVLQVL